MLHHQRAMSATCAAFREASGTTIDMKSSMMSRCLRGEGGSGGGGAKQDMMSSYSLVACDGAALSAATFSAAAFSAASFSAAAFSAAAFSAAAF